MRLLSLLLIVVLCSVISCTTAREHTEVLADPSNQTERIETPTATPPVQTEENFDDNYPGKTIDQIFHRTARFHGTRFQRKNILDKC